MSKLKLKWSEWGYALGQTVIGGVASSGAAWLGMLVGNQVDKTVEPLNVKELGIVVITSTLLHLFFFLKQSPLPQVATGNTEQIKKEDVQ